LTHWQHPRFFAYFPTSSTFEAMLGDLLSSSTASPGFNVCCLEYGNIAGQQAHRLPHETVVCKPRMHRARGRSHGLGGEDVWTRWGLLECKRSGWRCHSGQMMILSTVPTKLNLFPCLPRPPRLTQLLLPSSLLVPDTPMNIRVQHWSRSSFM
jgi:hypothetical protein